MMGCRAEMSFFAKHRPIRATKPLSADDSADAAAKARNRQIFALRRGEIVAHRSSGAGNPASSAAADRRGLSSVESRRLLRDIAGTNRPILQFLKSNPSSIAQDRVAGKLSNHVFGCTLRLVNLNCIYNLSEKNWEFRGESATRPRAIVRNHRVLVYRCGGLV